MAFMWKKKMASFDSLTDWQVKCDGLLERGNFLFHSSLWADCCFYVGPSKTPVRAHRFLLAMGSPVFETMFYGSIPEGNDPIPIPDIEPTVFLQMLRYIYTDSVCLNSVTTAFELHYCAKKYMLPFLVKLCTAYLSDTLTPYNVCSVYEHAAFHEEHQLLHDCLKVMKAQTQEILESPSFLEANLDTIVMMFSLEPLNIDSEIKLLEAIERYSNAKEIKKEDEIDNSEKEKIPAQGDITTIVDDDDDDDLEMIELPPLVIEVDSTDDEQQKSEDSSVTVIRRTWRYRKRKADEDSNKDGEKKEEKKTATTTESKPNSTIRSAIHLIRFLTLTPPELASCQSAARLLTKEEVFAILMNISSENTYQPMPEGFSTSRTNRSYPQLLPELSTGLNQESEQQQFFGNMTAPSNETTPTITASPLQPVQPSGSEHVQWYGERMRNFVRRNLERSGGRIRCRRLDGNPPRSQRDDPAVPFMLGLESFHSVHSVRRLLESENERQRQRDGVFQDRDEGSDQRVRRFDPIYDLSLRGGMN